MPPDDQAAVEPEVSEDLHSLISKAFDEHEVKPDAPEPTESRARAPDGKFAKAEPAEPAAEEPAEPEKPAPEEKPAEEEARPATSEPPNHWNAEDKETFKALTPQAQQFLLRRHAEMEGDYTRKTQQHAAFVRDYDPVRQMFAPYEQQIRQIGHTPASIIKAWSDVEKDLVEGRGVDVVRRLAENYRMDKRQLAQALGLTGAAGNAGAGTEAPPAPEGAQPIVLPPELQRQLQELQQGHQQVTQILTAQQQAAQREAEGRVMNTIEAFKSAKDGSGQLLHPHYDELEADMVDLWKLAAAAGQQPTLEEIYDKAVWANTSTRQKLLNAQSAASEAQRKAAEDKQRAEARAKAERARKASSSVTGAPGSAQARMNSQPGDRSLRAELEAAAEELNDA